MPTSRFQCYAHKKNNNAKVNARQLENLIMCTYTVGFIRLLFRLVQTAHDARHAILWSAGCPVSSVLPSSTGWPGLQ